jgi:hypothetical protein
MRADSVDSLEKLPGNGEERPQALMNARFCSLSICAIVTRNASGLNTRLPQLVS